MGSEILKLVERLNHEFFMRRRIHYWACLTALSIKMGSFNSPVAKFFLTDEECQAIVRIRRRKRLRKKKKLEWDEKKKSGVSKKERGRFPGSTLPCYMLLEDMIPLKDFKERLAVKDYESACAAFNSRKAHVGDKSSEEVMNDFMEKMENK